MKKKLVSLLLVLAMAATGLAGCAGNSAGTGDSAEQSGEAQGESQTVSTPSNFQEDLTSLRGNKTPDEEEIDKVNTTLNDT